MFSFCFVFILYFYFMTQKSFVNLIFVGTYDVRRLSSWCLLCRIYMKIFYYFFVLYAAKKLFVFFIFVSSFFKYWRKNFISYIIECEMPKGLLIVK